jgi:magnesium transporter
MELKNLSDFVMQEAGTVSRLFRRQTPNQGLAPGELVHVGERLEKIPRITVIDYTADHVEEKELASGEDCFPFRESPSITWINIDGIHDTKLIETVGTHFALHPLVMEDIVNAAQHPKIEYFENYTYLVVKMLRYDASRHGVVSEQVSLILGRNFVLSFQEQQGDVFDPVRQRIRDAKGRVRTCGADYLAYVLLDAIVDGYFVILDRIGEVVDALDAEVLDTPSPQTPRAIQHLRTELILLRKAVWPLRESISALQRSDSDLLTADLRPYLSDLYDHTIQVADTTETMRDLVSGLRDTYLSTISNRMNEVMKVLTIIATIFIPITFVAGIYGMNFKNMPELEWPHGYYVALGAMAAMVVGMIAYFRKKGWL